MKEIRGDAKNIRKLLSRQKFGIDYYQREYRWQRKHVRELIDDLTGAFLDNYKPSDRRSDVERYDRYFLGSIITSDDEGKYYIVDGQQRLTTITLILIYLYKSVGDEDLKSTIGEHIFSSRFGVRSYNLDVKSREQCMDSLFKGEPSDETDEMNDPSVRNILDRYSDVESTLSEAFQRRDNESDTSIADYFADWLIESVYLVDITAGNDADAYTVFETMNDRGLSLAPAEMLRGYLLANIGDSDRRATIAKAWDHTMLSLHDLGGDEGAKAIQSWLRSQHATTIRSSGGRASPEDFDVIGSEFHRWVRDRRETLGLMASADYEVFIERDFQFYARWYAEVVRAGNQVVDGLEPFYYVGQTTFTLHPMAALAPLIPGEPDELCKRKLRTVGTAIDCLLHRRIWNSQSIAQSIMRVRMFQELVLGVRGLGIDQLRDKLCDLLDDEDSELDAQRFAEADFRLHGNNRPKIHNALARITEFVETGSGRRSSFIEYLRRWGKGSYQIEHVLPESHRGEFDNFDYHRNRLGALVLLPRSINPSLGNMRYENKREHYPKENMLAGSLHERVYENNPDFNRFIRDSGLPFKPYEVFDVDAINERQELYRLLAEHIWSTDSIRRAAEA